MTIQLPVLLWTVINFCLFALILNRLLFKPILAFMDRRKVRIDAAKAKKAEYEAALAESARALEEFRNEERRQVALVAKEALALAHADAESILGEAASARMHKIAEHKAELGIEHHELGEALEEQLEKLADAYIATLVS